jgi:hypothetical protein
VVAINFGDEPRHLPHSLTDGMVTEVASDGINEGGPAAMTLPAGRAVILKPARGQSVLI